jgi:prepilin-type N-terminal cleavage/methylation domain-containing protein
VKARRLHRGFTLIEIAIALTVISLVLGGILIAGNVLIERSRVASLLSKIKDLGTASRDFKSRYGYFPGDLPNATTYITGISAGCSYAVTVVGVGNGLVDTATESTCALEHLVRAGLLTKIEQDQTGNYVIRSQFGTGQVSLWFDNTTNQNVIRITALPCDIALEIDRKLDNDSTTPFSQGTVLGIDTAGGIIQTCTVGGTNDPLTLLIGY